MEIPEDICDAVALESLQTHYRYMVKDYETPPKMAVFDNDRNVDKALIKKHMDAFALIIKYYGGKV